MFTFAEKLKQMSNIEHKDVGVSSLKGTPSRKIYIKTSTEAVYNPEGVTQEYINNHVDGSKIVNGTITNNKKATTIRQLLLCLPGTQAVTRTCIAVWGTNRAIMI